jgi:repressor LexA
VAHSPPGRTREQVYQFVRDELLVGRTPSIREVQQAMGFRAVESARKQLDRLVAEGRLIKAPGRARSYRLPARPTRPPAEVPVLGRVQAGDLAAAIEAPEGVILVERPAAGAELFALTVRGASMIGAGILPGDLVVVRRQPTAESGEVVVALVEDETTVKRLRLRRRRVELHPENPEFKPIIPDPKAVRILGKVVEVRRWLE